MNTLNTYQRPTCDIKEQLFEVSAASAQKIIARIKVDRFKIRRKVWFVHGVSTSGAEATFALNGFVGFFRQGVLVFSLPVIINHFSEPEKNIHCFANRPDFFQSSNWSLWDEPYWIRHGSTFNGCTPFRTYIDCDEIRFEQENLIVTTTWYGGLAVQSEYPY